MQYQVSRNGQTYGPYTLEDLQRYVASGNVLPTDLAKSDDMPDWVPVAQILGSQIPGGQATAVPPYTVPVQPYPPVTYASPTGAAYPDPPNLPWGLLLLIDVFTCGIFQPVWNLILAAWARRIEPQSTALYFYIGALILTFANAGSSFGNVFAAMHHHPVHPNFIGVILGIVNWVVRLIARFNLRETLEAHYNGPEPLGLRLNGVMTFFFGGIYFTYKLNEINGMKQALRYRNAAL
jgi:GYF domain 2